MDEDNPVVPHQYMTVRELSAHWNKVSVLTCSQEKKVAVPFNVNVVNLSWSSKPLIFSILYFYTKIIPLLFKGNVVVFSHMTDTLSALIAPICYILRRKHFLWYAHASVPLRLKFVSKLATGIITSTPGSCNIVSSKVKPIGQGIPIDAFSCQQARALNRNSLKCIYIGRMDPSKRVEEVINAFQDIRLDDKVLWLIGAPTVNNEWYFKELMSKYEKLIIEKRILFLGAMTHNSIREYLCRSNLMIHAFQGSLDKVLLEATASKTYVATCNHEFLRSFGLAQDLNAYSDDLDLLQNQIEFFLKSDESQINETIESNYRITSTYHSFGDWAKRINMIIGESRETLKK